MPYMRDGQEFLRSYLFPHGTDEQKEYSMEAVDEAIGLLCAGLAHLFGVTDEDNDADILIATRKAEIEMLNLFYDESNYGSAWRNIIYAYGYVGYLYVKKGDYEKGLQYFKKEAELAKRFDSLDRITVLHSIFFDGREFDKHTLGSTFVATSSVKTLLKEKYPLPDEFKTIPEFQEIIKTLQ
jgi:tetratricopeptide (TPR) repeat protein